MVRQRESVEIGSIRFVDLSIHAAMNSNGLLLPRHVDETFRLPRPGTSRQVFKDNFR